MNIRKHVAPFLWGACWGVGGALVMPPSWSWRAFAGVALIHWGWGLRNALSQQ